MKYNKQCPIHDNSEWGNIHWMREDDIVCRECYHKLPSDMRKLLWGGGIDIGKAIKWLREN